RPPFEREHHEEAREQGVAEDRAVERPHAASVLVEVSAERKAARLLEPDFGAPEELLVLHLLFAEARQRTRSRRIGLPEVRRRAVEMGCDEVLEVPEDVHVAERTAMVQDELL